VPAVPRFAILAAAILLLTPAVLRSDAARVLVVNAQERTVEVDLHGIAIVFRAQNPKRFTPGETAQVKIECVKNYRGHCDFASPYVLRAEGAKVQPLLWKFPKKKLTAWVHHAPGDKGPASYDGLILHCMIGSVEMMMTLRAEDPRAIRMFSRVSGDTTIQISFLENDPHRVVVSGVRFINVATFFPRPRNQDSA